MKRKRIQLNALPNSLHDKMSENPQIIFAVLEEMDVAIPNEAEYMLLCWKTTATKADIRFYGDQESYLADYTKCLLKNRDDYDFYSFRLDEEIDLWDLFLPPPVIGLGIKTRLRPGISSL